MSPRKNIPKHRFSKLVLSLLLAVPTTGPWLNYPLMDARANERVDYSSLRSIAEVRAAAERNIALAMGTKPVAEDSADQATLASSTPIEDSPVQRLQQELPELSSALPPVAPVANARRNANRFEGLVVALSEKTVGDETLDEVRGGFEMADSNLKFSFGIERAVFINGELIATTVLNQRDLQWVAGGEAQAQVVTSGAAAAAAAVGVVQNGTGNNFATQAGSNVTHTVIQNTLNGQTIQNVTTINAVVNSAQVMRTLNVQAAVQDGIINSLRH